MGLSIRGDGSIKNFHVTMGGSIPLLSNKRYKFFSSGLLPDLAWRYNISVAGVVLCVRIVLLFVVVLQNNFFK